MNYHRMMAGVIAGAGRRRFDPDAADYFARVVAAESTISTTNQAAVNAFVVGCKSDGIWSAIKACCLLAGPDTLAGALVPLVGPAPTLNGTFLEWNYNRSTGIAGNGSNNYIDTNRNGNADPQDDFHLTIYRTANSTTGNDNTQIATSGSNSGSSSISNAFRSRSNGFDPQPNGWLQDVGFFGSSRNSSSNYTGRFFGNSSTFSRNSQSPESASFTIAGRRNPINFGLFNNARFSFYSIGESLDLALLDARLETYMASLT